MARASAKSPEAFRTISEAADALDLPQHVLRFWETRFSQIKPMKRSGGRRYYRPSDILLLKGIRHLLYDEGYTIKGVQRILRENGVAHVSAFADPGTPAGEAAVTPSRTPAQSLNRRTSKPVSIRPLDEDPVRDALSKPTHDPAPVGRVTTPSHSNHVMQPVIGTPRASQPQMAEPEPPQYQPHQHPLPQSQAWQDQQPAHAASAEAGQDKATSGPPGLWFAPELDEQVEMAASAQHAEVPPSHDAYHHSPASLAPTSYAPAHHMTVSDHSAAPGVAPNAVSPPRVTGLSQNGAAAHNATVHTPRPVPSRPIPSKQVPAMPVAANPVASVYSASAPHGTISHDAMPNGSMPSGSMPNATMQGETGSDVSVAYRQARPGAAPTSSPLAGGVTLNQRQKDALADALKSLIDCKTVLDQARERSLASARTVGRVPTSR